MSAFSPDTIFPVRRARTELPAKERVFGIERDGLAKAWPLAALVDRRVANDDVAGDPIVLVAGGKRIWVDGVSVRSGPARYEAGAEVRAYLRRSHTFRPGNDPNELIDEKGGRWQVQEERLEGPEGERLARAPGVLAYWFGWHSFHPRTELYHEVLPPALQPGRP